MVWNVGLSCDKFIVYNCEFETFRGNFFFLGWFRVLVCFGELKGLMLFVNWVGERVVLLFWDVICCVWIFLRGFGKCCCCCWGFGYDINWGCLIGDVNIVFCIGGDLGCCLFGGRNFDWDCIFCFICSLKFCFCITLILL